MRRLLPLVLVLLVLAGLLAGAWMIVALRPPGAPQADRSAVPAVVAPQPSDGGALPAADLQGGAAARARVAESRLPVDNAGAVLEGTVTGADTDDDWRPLEAVRVVLLGEPDGAPRERRHVDVDFPSFQELPDVFVRHAPPIELATARTDPQGAFRIEAVPLHARALRVEAEGWLTVHRLLPDPLEAMQIVLERARTVRVRVTDSGGTPLGGARLFATDWDGEPPHTIVETDAGGEAGLRIGDAATVLVTAEGHGSEVREVEGDTTIRLRPERPISGTVVDAADAPVAGALVFSWESEEEPVRTGPDGAFVLRRLPADAWAHTLGVSADGFGYRAAEAVPGTVGLVIRLDRLATISGRVLLPDGRPAERARVEMLGGWRGVASDREGRFVLPYEVPEDAEPAVVRAQQLAPQRHGHGEFPRPYGTQAEVEVAVAAGGTVADVVLRLAPIPESYVFVRALAPDGSRVGNVHVTLSFDHADGLPVSDGLAVGGWFRRVPYPPGTTLGVTVHQTGRGDLEPSVDAELETRALPAGEGDVVRFPEAAAPETAEVADVTLRLVDGDGRLLPAGCVRAWELGFTGPEIARCGERPDGDPHDPRAPERVVRAPAGSALSVRVAAAGYGARSFHVPGPPAGPSVVELRLDRGATLTGRLAGAERSALAAASVDVTVLLADGSRTTGWADADEGLAADGSFRIADLAAGQARITVWDGELDQALADLTVTLRAGAHVDLGEVRLDALPHVRGAVRDGSRPVAGVILEVRDDTAILAMGATDAQGAFSLRAPTRDDVMLLVSRVTADGDYTTVAYAFADVAAAGGIPLRPPAAGFVRVRPAGGVPAGAELLGTAVRVPGGPRVLADATGLFGDDADDDAGGGGGCIEVFALPVGVVEIVVTARTAEGALLTWRGTADVPRDDRAVEVTLQR